jgi:hypothetical protein
MSGFVELPQEVYPADALAPFTTSDKFNLENARAMMWLSQLAYETAHRRKVSDILESWTLTMREFISNDPGTGLPPHSACVVVAEGSKAMFVTFAGSDPGKAIDWVTDFQALPTPSGLHSGFDAAVGTVWSKIQSAIENRLAPDKPVFFTGHSLGGALAILAAARTAHLTNPPEIVVYTFGSPRNGGAELFTEYTPPLGNKTFRLIHGTDVVPTVPPSLLGTYRHVGCPIQCASGGLFDPSTMMTKNDDKPDILQSARQAGLSDLKMLAFKSLLPAIGPLIQVLGPELSKLLVAFLPRMIRDHIPANYFRALSISVPFPPLPPLT